MKEFETLKLEPNYKSILDLDKKLTELNIKHELCRLFDGYMICYPDYDTRICDVIEHKFSYGSKNDQLEACGFDECGEDVIGDLTVEAALKLFINADKKRNDI